MKKIKLIIGLAFISALMSVLLAGCGQSGSSANPEKDQLQGMAANKHKGTIRSIEVVSAAKNSAHIYRLEYPYNYYTYETSRLSYDEGGIIPVEKDLENIIPVEDLTEEDIAYLLDYVNILSENKSDKEGDIAYSVYIVYYDEEGERQSAFARGCQAFPEGWSDFITYMNKLSGGYYLTAVGDLVVLTPEFVTEVFGITDADLKVGSLEDLIAVNDLDMLDATKHMFDMRREIHAYYRTVYEPAIAPARPTSLESVDSTREEYDAFVNALLSELGGDWQEVDSDQDYLRHIANISSGMGFYIGRSADLPNMHTWVPTENHSEMYCTLHLDAHMEGMTQQTDFYYNADKKFILSDPNSDRLDPTDEILTFVELSLH